METEFKKVFIDTAPFIYFIEKDNHNPHYHENVKQFLMDAYQNDVRLFTSVITIGEYMVFPYRINNMSSIVSFKELIAKLDIYVAEIGKKIASDAAKIRAEYKFFNGMDALQLAAAIQLNCDLFLTNDKQLKQFRKLKCITIEDLV